MEISPETTWAALSPVLFSWGPCDWAFSFFSSEGDKRFSQWFYGEIFVETKELMPDARRDYLRECEYRSVFENYVKKDFSNLKELCNKASDIRGAQEKIRKAEQEQNKIEKKKQIGFLSSEEQRKSEQKFEEFKQKKEREQQKLIKLQNEDKQKGAPLAFMFDKELLGTRTSSVQPIVSQIKEHTQVVKAPQVEYKTKLRTDNEIYQKFSSKEKLLINTVYNTIYNAFADEDMR